jgi:hypothetical protein
MNVSLCVEAYARPSLPSVRLGNPAVQGGREVGIHPCPMQTYWRQSIACPLLCAEFGQHPEKCRVVPRRSHRLSRVLPRHADQLRRSEWESGGSGTRPAAAVPRQGHSPPIRPREHEPGAWQPRAKSQGTVPAGPLSTLSVWLAVRQCNLLDAGQLMSAVLVLHCMACTPVSTFCKPYDATTSGPP